MSRVAIVVVTYNSALQIGSCLDSLQSVEDVEIVVVDNASSDSTLKEVERRRVRFIANPTNAGFAAAMNQGVRATAAPLILLLNPDACLQRGLASLAEDLDDQIGRA